MHWWKTEEFSLIATNISRLKQKNNLPCYVLCTIKRPGSVENPHIDTKKKKK